MDRLDIFSIALVACRVRGQTHGVGRSSHHMGSRDRILVARPVRNTCTEEPSPRPLAYAHRPFEDFPWINVCSSFESGSLSLLLLLRSLCVFRISVPDQVNDLQGIFSWSVSCLFTVAGVL